MASQALPANWQQLSLSNLALTVQSFAVITKNFADPTVNSLRAQVASYVWNQYFANPQTLQTLQPADIDAVVQLLGVVGPYLSPDQLNAASAAVLSVDNNPTALATLTIDELRHLVSTLKTLKVSGAAAESVVTGWMNASNTWTNLDAVGMAHFALLLPSDDASTGMALKSTVAATAWTNFLSQPSFYSSLTLNQLLDVVWAFGPELTDANRASTAANLMQRFSGASSGLGDISIQRVMRITNALNSAGFTDIQKAQVFALWAIARDQRQIYTADDGGPPKQKRALAQLATSAKSATAFAGAVETQLQANGDPAGPTSAKLLVAMHSVTGDLPAYVSQLNTRLADPTLVGDARSTILLAVGLAQEILNPKGLTLSQITWGQQASAAAQSPRMQLECCQWLVRRYAIKKDYIHVNSYLQSLQSNVSDPPTLQQLNVLVSLLQTKRAMVGDATTAANTNAANTTTVLQSELSFLQSELALAQAQGRSDTDIEAMENLIAVTQQQLATTTTQPSAP
jgi:hypothetical protein